MSKIIFSVSELNQATQQILEEHFPSIWVEGELSNVKRYPSGHVYFSLKDAKAQIRCVLFRFQAQKLKLELQDGLQVQLQAKVSLYPDRGDYQLIVQDVELAGDGQLKKAYDQLVKKLSAEGLFEQNLKKPLPLLPKHIGIISSASGAALRDILSVLKRRFPSIPITLYPTSVQGQQAAPELVKALKFASQQGLADVLILARGGGSLEDLWPFNDETLARTIFDCPIPLVTGIGHEIDFTIADFVADQRAPTPSAAAELITPDQQKWLQQLQMSETQLIKAIQQYLQRYAQKLDWLQRQLQHPGKIIRDQLQQVFTYQVQLKQAIHRYLKNRQVLLSSASRTLERLSPQATLNRGYAIAFNEAGTIVRSRKDTTSEQRLKLQFKDGEVFTTVE